MIPSTIRDVSTNWLGECVGASVKDMTVEQIGQGIGIMGDIYRVRLETDGDGPESVVVKLPSSFEENRSQGVMLGMFEAEVRFYRELAGAVSVGLPRVYHCDIEHGTANFVIVMEDLCDLTMVDQFVGMTVEQARAAATVLANVHAVWWDEAKREDLEWIPTMIGPRIEMVDQMLVGLLPPFLEKFASYLPEGGADVYEAFAGRYLSINQVIAGRSPWTVVHQDFRVENVMFGADRVVVIDWQGIGRGPGAYDLAYILGGSMDTELRREHENSLVRAYHDELLRLGITGYTFDDLWQDYGLAHFMGGLATSMVVGGGMDLSNERGMQLIVAMASRHAAAALDHGGPERILTDIR